MGVERRRGGDDDPESGDSADRDAPADDESSERDASPDSEESVSRVHVRRLDAVDTLRWSWEVLGDRRELLVVALAVTLPSVVAALGISRSSPSAEPEFAAWVPWLYLAQLLATLVVWGAVYLIAADAVANRSRPIRRHLVAATKRLPALVATGIATGLLVGLCLLPILAVAAVTRDGGGGLDGGSSVGPGSGDFAFGSSVDLDIFPSVAFGVSPAVGLFLALVFGLSAVYVFQRLLLAYPACVIDRKGPFASARAGWQAATGTVGKVFAVSAAYVIVVGVGQILATAASNAVFARVGGWYDVTAALVGATFGTVLLPLFALALAHLYLEGSRNR